MNNDLTKRELEVLRYVAKGLTNREIAEQLSVTHHTVKAHVASILKKMGVKKRLDLIIRHVIDETLKTI